VRPILDRVKSSDSRIIGSAIGDMNGYLPTHLSERSQPQGPDPVWNDEHCRNKRILIDDTTRAALASDKPATLDYDTLADVTVATVLAVRRLAG